MVNGKFGDNPVTDLTIHGRHPFPPDIEDLLLRIDAAGKGPGRWPLGENWPFSPREFEWEKGNDLENARRDLTRLLQLVEQGRGDEILIHPLTRKPLSQPSG